MSREERRKKRQEDEARKNGLLPPEVDREGNLINPHIPEFMSKSPWYLKQDERDGLKHQKAKKTERVQMDTWYKRGRDTLVEDSKTGSNAFKRGSCRNCGATTHKEKDCLERPRKVGAWKTGETIGTNDVLQPKLQMSYDESRDRWNGYDATDHVRTVKLFNKAEEEKRKQLLQEQNEKFQRGETATAESDSDGEENDDVLGLKDVGKPVKASVSSSLRIRENTAKYLRNLDLNSAHYDPKTRSMRSNPNPDADPNEADYAGDNFVKLTGDVVEFAKTQVFAWEASSHGNSTDIHLQANPTQVALAKKQFEERRKQVLEKRSQELAAKYGTSSDVKSKPAAVLIEEDTSYVEYSKDGRILKGANLGTEQQTQLSKYEEDVLEGNHSAIWGSYFDPSEMKWGYGCCGSMIRNSYCTGIAGLEAVKASKAQASARPPAFHEIAPVSSTSSSSKSEIPNAEIMESYRKETVRQSDPMAGISTDTILPLKN